MVKSVLIPKNNTEINQTNYLICLYIKSFFYLLSKDLLFLSFLTFQIPYIAEIINQKNAINNNIGKNFMIKFIKFAHHVKIGSHIHWASAVSLNTNFAQSADSITFISLS